MYSDSTFFVVITILLQVERCCCCCHRRSSCPQTKCQQLYFLYYGLWTGLSVRIPPVGYRHYHLIGVILHSLNTWGWCRNRPNKGFVKVTDSRVVGGYQWYHMYGTQQVRVGSHRVQCRYQNETEYIHLFHGLLCGV